MRQLSEMLAGGRVPTEQRRQQYYESLATESQRLQRLVENLLDFGRLQAGARTFTLAPLDPGDLVQRVVEEFRAQPLSRPCAIDVEPDTGPATMRADADAMALALHNLLDNAVKYSGDDAHVTVSWRRDGDRIALRVRDTGAGIAPEDRARIFERFVRGTATANGVRGTGIGLAVVKQVVTGQGGEVAVDSEPGKGSTFTIWMPLAHTHSGDAA
jgi:two-component system phosphate regulon sensor histidine kinase PhoR